MKKLRTTLQVIEHLGGPKQICALIPGTNTRQVWHWYGRAEKFPAYTYVVLQNALKRKDASAPDRLWTMKGIPK
jgi:hypothetical protein